MEKRADWLTFDCYGTLIQWDEGLEQIARSIITARGGRADPAQLLQLYDTHASELEVHAPFKTFKQVAPAAFQAALDELGVVNSEEDGTAFLRAIPTFKPFRKPSLRWPR